MPKVSVIVPNYNHAAYLEQRLQSILDQTYQDFEIIYLDDVSTDNSNEVFAQFAGHSKISAIFNQENSGSPFKQWNKGVQKAKGDYIWIAESDDYSDPRFLETLVPVLEQHSNVGLVYCQSWQVDESGNRLKLLDDWTSDLSETRWQSDFTHNGQDECRNFLVFKNTIPNASAVLIRRSVFEKSGYAADTFRLSGDWVTWFKCLLNADIGFIAEPLNYFRKHQSSVRSKSWDHGLDIFEEMKVFLFFKDKIALSPDTNAFMANKLLTEWFSRMMMMRRLTGLNPQYIRETYQAAKKIDAFVEFRLAASLVTYLTGRLKFRVDNLIGHVST